MQENFFPQIIPTIAAIYEHHYPEVAERQAEVVAVLVKEEKAFRTSLRKGIKHLSAYRRTGVTGAELFVLYDNFGFPGRTVDRGGQAVGHRVE